MEHNNQRPLEPKGIQLDKWIKKAEDEIAFEMTELQQITGPFKEAEEKAMRAQQEYETVKKDYTEKLNQIEQDKAYKDWLVRKREGYHPAKKIRQLTVTSATNKPPKKERKISGSDAHRLHPNGNINKDTQLRWKDWTVEILKEEDKFTLPESLFSIIEKKYLNGVDKRVISKARYSYVNILLPGYHRTSIGEGKPSGKTGKIGKEKGIIIGYDAGGVKVLKYGLREWVDDEFVPLPKYLREIMLSSKAEGGSRNEIGVKDIEETHSYSHGDNNIVPRLKRQ